jgi:acetate kinase
MKILTVNVGSSTLKSALYQMSGEEQLLKSVLLDGISRTAALPDLAAALRAMLDQLGSQQIDAIGHRVVHGGPLHAAPAVVNPALLAELRALVPLAPLHLPPELEVVERLAALHPQIPQVVCFDTAFHRTIPEVARTYAFPKRFRDAGLQRYGFHGLSYEFILEELAGLADPQESKGKVIVAHLGAGASLAAIHRGKCVDTTMGLTPTGGLVMATRPGDLDPDIVLWLIREQRLSADDVDRLFQHECGMKGLSGVSGDVRDLLRPDAPADARLAIDVFCHQARKMIAAMAASLNGVETLVFTAGIGEHSPEIRNAICEPLTFLGIELDPDRNSANAEIISTNDSWVKVRVIPTNEERMIARHTSRALAG